MTKIGLDIFGGDDAPNINIEGALFALKNGYISGKLYLIGADEGILSKFEEFKDKVEIVKAKDLVDFNTKPTEVLRLKESSIYVGCEMMKKGELDAFVSAGSTGALLAAGTFITGRIEGIERPALVIPLPGKDNKVKTLVDGGANSEIKPKHFLDFAKVGIAFSKFMGIKDPKVGLLNIGTEREKGNKLVKEGYELLENDEKINFVGFVESRDLFGEVADVFVTDGFTGNMVLKTLEGTAKFITTELKNSIFESGFFAKLGALMMKNALKKLKDKLDYRKYGGTFFLGINGILVKAHGSSDAEAIMNALKVANDGVKSNIVSEIKNLLS